MKKTVVVGMSGGVDSSVCAYLLKEQGYDVIGVTMQIWRPENACDVSYNGGCCGLSAVDDARRVAEVIGIPYYVMDFREEFQKYVIDNFTSQYVKGRTPNPCIECNRHVKWEALLRKSRDIGADFLATGHYARISRLENGRYTISASKTAAKDQTYALYALTQDQLSHTLLPIGEYEKTDVRKIAEEAGLPVAHKKDSQEICFVPDGDYASFIENEEGVVVPGPGDFVTSDGTFIAKHKGITHYTVGQRRGLGVAAGERIYVTDIDPSTNRVTLGADEDLFTSVVTADDVCWMGLEGITAGDVIRVKAKIRYNHGGELGVLESAGDGKVRVTFDKPVRAAAPGQALVFYDESGTYIYGGGTIVQ
ncbi:MAG: tRNA 2-thiouridine(34) synthase MnmA [Lachnospiraceae bacterium]|nr:tRNA 2-thiouridine(34) synthase MnmA [Lachnospiraceae bacterium]